ncbi:MAG: deoxyribodipyrimidine photo-lyase, partial [Maribacter sp.]|nr:deoxyribodipyrimidine photo-lyase [Maribacter sp.]
MNNLIWFRNDLRVRDNASLVEAMKGNKLTGFYCFESSFFEIDEFGFKRTEKFRAKFLLETVQQLKQELEKLNIPLFVYHGNSADYLPNLIENHSIDTIFLQKEWTRDELVILNDIKKKIPFEVKFNEVYDQFLYHPDDIPFNDFKSIPDVFTNFRKKCEAVCKVRPIPKLPPKMSHVNLVINETELPTLNKLGFNDFSTNVNSAFPFKGGELEALKRVQNYFWETKKLGFYKKTRNGLIGVDY